MQLTAWCVQDDHQIGGLSTLFTGIPYLYEEYTITFIRASASESPLKIMNVTINLTIDYIGSNVLLQDIIHRCI